jgi:hypothetical protein
MSSCMLDPFLLLCVPPISRHHLLLLNGTSLTATDSTVSDIMEHLSLCLP